MSSLRSDDDTWDIATSVGATAVMVAAARARETDSAHPLIRDPYARMLVAGAGAGPWTEFMEESLLDRMTAVDPEAAAIFSNMLGYQAVRTLFFDTFFTEAAAAGIRQIVILASGLDSRAYRLAWPAGTVVYEVDQPKVLEYKSATLRKHGVEPTAERREVAVDLRQDWPAALVAAGFDPSRPTAWLAEGLLMYLPADGQDRLFELITELSAPGSRLSAEAVKHYDEERREQMRERFEKMTDQVGLERTVNIHELIYNDPDRADLIEWLSAHGWTATGAGSADEMKRLDRWIDVPGQDAENYSTYVIAERD